jgi:hypothetical protein
VTLDPVLGAGAPHSSDGGCWQMPFLAVIARVSAWISIPGCPLWCCGPRGFLATAAKSRYVAGKILWQPNHGETYTDLIERLMDFGRRLGRRSLIVCTSHEMAVLVAQHRDVLEEHFVLPAVAAQLRADRAVVVPLSWEDA